MASCILAAIAGKGSGTFAFHKVFPLKSGNTQLTFNTLCWAKQLYIHHGRPLKSICHRNQHDQQQMSTIDLWRQSDTSIIPMDISPNHPICVRQSSMWNLQFVPTCGQQPLTLGASGTIHKINMGMPTSSSAVPKDPRLYRVMFAIGLDKNLTWRVKQSAGCPDKSHNVGEPSVASRQIG